MTKTLLIQMDDVHTSVDYEDGTKGEPSPTSTNAPNAPGDAIAADSLSYWGMTIGVTLGLLFSATECRGKMQVLS